MTENDRLLVSIINWNDNQATAACLESIGRIERDRQPDILLIDNHSTRERLDVPGALRKSLRSLDIVENDENLGFAGGHNHSLRYAIDHGYDFVILLNNDTELLHEGVFSQLTSALQADDRALAAAPTILSDRDGTIWYGGGDLNLVTSSTAHRGVGGTYASSTSDPQDVSFLSGCCLAIKVAALKQFDALLCEDFFMYWEDADWSAQARKAGFRLLHVPSATILHNVSSSLGLASPTYIYYIIRGNIFFIKRNLALWARPIGYGRVVVVSLKYLIRSFGGQKRRQTVRALRFGWADGLTRRSGKLAREL